MRKILTIGLLRVSTVLLNFGVTTFIARSLDANEGGIFFFYLTTASFFSLLALAGLNQTELRVVSRAMSKNNYDWAVNRAILFVKLIFLVTSISIFIISIGWGLIAEKHLIGNFWYSEINSNLTAYAVLLSLSTVQIATNDTLRSFGMPNQAVIASGPVLLGSFLFLYLISIKLTGHASLSLAILSFLSGTILSIAYSVLYLYKSLHGKITIFKSPKLRLQLKSSKKYLIYSLPLLSQSIAIFFVTQSAVFIIGILGNGSDVAIFAAATRLAAMFAFVNTIYSVFMPMEIANKLNNSVARKHLEIQLRKLSQIGTTLCFPIFFAVVIYASEIMGIFFGQFYKNGGIVLIALSFGYYINVITGLRGLIFSMSGRGMNLLFITIFFGFSSILLCVLGYKISGLNGAAIGVAVAMSAQCLAELILARRIFRIDPSIGFLGKIK